MDNNDSRKIILLAKSSGAVTYIYNSLKGNYNIDKVIVEDAVFKKLLLKRRIKKLGLKKVAGQLLFQVLIQPLLKLASTSRTAALIKQYALDDTPVPQNLIHKVESINLASTITYIQNLKPDVIIINGTRILSKMLINTVGCPILNTHAGITPKYRGVHGGYWALVHNDIKNCGVTVHLVDAGIDTGGILYQKSIEVDRQDNFMTYPVHQLGTALPYLQRAVADALNGELQIIKGPSESKLWHHPTITQYIKNYLFKGVK